MPKPKRIDYCHICTQKTELTFEHVPPQAAFNNRRMITLNFEEAFNLGPGDSVTSGKISQKGSGGYTLCQKCNNDTGAWYGAKFVDWCYAAADIVIKSKGNPKVLFLKRAFPLEIIKQIVTMFFSANPPAFARNNQELVQFIKIRRLKYLNPKYRFFTYYNLGGRFRFAGLTAQGSFKSNSVILMSEVGFTPLGFLMTLNSPPPDNRLFEITDFSQYTYDEPRDLTIYPPILPTHMLLPGDYRTAKQIQEDYIKNSRGIWTPPE